MKKILIISIIAIAAIGGSVYFLRNSSKTSSGQPQAPVVSVTTGKTYDIAVSNFSFNPAVLDVEKGGTVVWTNQDSAPHTIAGNDFMSKTLSKGESFSFTFDSLGDYEYICSIHPSMKGKIIVK